MSEEQKIIESVRALVNTYQDLYIKIMSAKSTLNDLEEQLDEIKTVLEVFKRK